MRKISFFAVALVLTIALLSCGAKSTGPAGTTTSGATKAVIKNNGTTIAYVVSWAERAEIVNVYIPSVDRYVTINLYTGLYESEACDSATNLYFSAGDCSGNAVAVNDTFIGESSKTIVYDQVGDKYYLVSGHQESNSYNSNQNARTGSSCQGVSGTNSASYDVTLSSRPYNFAAIAPLTITYE